MIYSLIILLLIAVYGVFVVKKKYKDIKNGKFCSCGCSDCPSSAGCPSKKGN